MLIRLGNIILLTLICMLAGCQSIGIWDHGYHPSSRINYYYCAWKELRRHFRWQDWSSHQAVKKEIQWFVNHPDHLLYVAKNATPFLHFILQRLKERQLPGELALIPMIESLYDPRAVSYAGAVGLWQMMPGTAGEYGVTENWWFDGKHDLLESTQAALDHIEYLYKRFDGQWLLALAAYNSGHGTVLKAIKKNRVSGKAINFWSLKLPKQTRKYIPRLLALATIVRNPNRFKIKLPQLKHEQYFEAVTIDTQVSLREIAKLIDMDPNELIRLNPGHKQQVTQPHGQHQILLPLAKVEDFSEKFDQSKISKRAFLIKHRIQPGDSLSRIAMNYGVPIKEIKELNGMDSDRIVIGKSLWIPKFIEAPKKKPKPKRGALKTAPIP